MTNGGIQRIGGDVLLGQIGDRAFDARVERRDDGRVRQVGAGERRELRRELGRLFRRDVETKDLDRDRPRAVRVAGKKDWSQDARPDLMQDLEASERGRGWIGRALSGQRVTPVRCLMLTLKGPPFNEIRR